MQERNNVYTNLTSKQHYFLFLLRGILGKTPSIRDALS